MSLIMMNVIIIVFVLSVHHCIGHLPSPENDSLDTTGPGIPSVTSGRVSGTLRNILNQESLVRFAIVQRIQRLVLDMTEVKNDFKDLQRTLVVIKDKLHSLETKDQKLEKENAKLKQTLQAIYTRNPIDELASTDFEKLKNETLLLKRKHYNLFLSNNAFQNQLNDMNGQMKKIDHLSTRLHIVEDSMQNIFLSINSSIENIRYDQNTSCTPPVTESSELLSVMTGTTSATVTSTSPPSHNVAFFTQNTYSVNGIGDLIFNETVINVGNGYNEASGMFTCPLTGLYMFAWNIASHGYGAQTYLLKNGYPVGVAAITDPKASSVDDSSTSFAVLRLNRNDKVNVHRYASGRTSSSFFAGWRIGNDNRDTDGFTVALNDSTSSSSPIKFNSVILDNNGSYVRYNYSFISTSPGLYVFGVTGEQTNGEYSDLQLLINGAQKVQTFSDSESGHSDSGAILSVFKLNSGDNVRVGGRHYVGYKGTTTFSGYKISNSTRPAFTAKLTSDTISSVVVFDNELLDTHGDYDRLSGIFTCSVPGIYLFTWSVETEEAELTTQLVIQIKGGSRINGPKIVGEETMSREFDTSTGVFIYKLKPGDTAQIQIVKGIVEGRDYSSFSGWLLF